MQGRAELGLLMSNKHVITLFIISLWHPLILESPWVRLYLVQQAKYEMKNTKPSIINVLNAYGLQEQKKRFFAVVF